MGADIVELTVGPEEHVFRVHRKVGHGIFTRRLLPSSLAPRLCFRPSE